MTQLAWNGGPKAVQEDPGDLFDWPIVTPAIEGAVLEVLRAGKMSGTDVTAAFEREYAEWHGVPYALAHSSGTAALQGAMYGLGIGHSDEIICPSITYWASCLPVYALGGTVVFADIDPETLCIDPDDIENHITSRTKAIVVVHYAAHPADMDRILPLAQKHGLRVIEDVSHAHGARYKDQLAGTMGDVAAFSLMSGKSLACGEGGIMITRDRRIYERALAFGHYARHNEFTLRDLTAAANLPWGGYKYRMHQLTSAMARVQLRDYAERMAEIDRAMNRFWDLLKGVPGLGDHRPTTPATTKGGWYAPHGLYRAEELGGLSITRFCQAVAAEGVPCSPGCNKALHLHPVFNTLDIYGQGKPTRIANLPDGVDVRQPHGSLPVTEGIQHKVYRIPWFKHDRPAAIRAYAEAFRKVAEQHRALLADDPGDPPELGSWALSRR
jgi:dTDP-4-amino-4,6-dideoxygalactose transaminase